MNCVLATLAIGVATITLAVSGLVDAHENNFPVNSHLDVVNFDLNSVRPLQPGRFVIAALTLDKPEIMRMRIAANRQMYKFCAKPAGFYPSLPSMYGIGSPDLPVNKLEVRIILDGTGPQRKSYKYVSWKYPYKRASTCDDDHCVNIREDVDLVMCRNNSVENNNQFDEWRAFETNGVKSLKIYDCDHGLTGTSSPEWDTNMTAMTPVRPGSIGQEIYEQVCRKVFKHEPYMEK